MEGVLWLPSAERHLFIDSSNQEKLFSELPYKKFYVVSLDIIHNNSIDQ